jgi:hypothetical protein
MVDLVEPSIDRAYCITAARESLIVPEDDDWRVAERMTKPITHRPVTSGPA